MMEKPPFKVLYREIMTWNELQFACDEARDKESQDLRLYARRCTFYECPSLKPNEIAVQLRLIGSLFKECTFIREKQYGNA